MTAPTDPLIEAIAQRTATLVIEKIPKREHPKAAYTVAEAGEQLGVCAATVRGYIAAGELEAIHLGPKTLRIKQSAITDYLNTRKAVAS